jgi:preprotein translocase subunit YajC
MTFHEVSALIWAAADPPPSGAPDMTRMLWMFGIVFFLLWLIILRPQKKERQERQRQIAAVKKGDRVVTIGGIHGKITDVDEAHDILTVEIAPKLAVKINRSAIASVESKGSGKPGPKSDGEDKQ